MNDSSCPQCGTRLTEEQGRSGVCPRCAMRAALGGPETSETAPLTREMPAEDAGPAPERIGAYRILRSIGEGGMGEVFLAEQSEPVRRRVALKVIKPGLDTKQVVARFEAERQALALMDHASIARVFDAGMTEGGRPYFVMEYVEGEPITEYADRKRLSLPERLRLFRKVCDGVQHAHRRGVIHRDLKPSNVLIAEEGAAAVPKIIDFGVAKAISKPLTERTLFTEMGIMIGTPEYMSPEQAEVSVLDVDTRTDVYSLGVMLYELLTGALPFDPAELRRAGYDEIRRRIREEEPTTPSARVSTLGDAATETAALRRTAVSSFRRELQGDLDWIVLCALAKEPDRRYGSPSEFSADVERYLRDEAVVARPPSVLYKTRKFVRRNRLFVTSVAVVSLSLIAGAVGTATFGLREARQRHATDAALEDLERVVEFQQGMLSEIDAAALGRRLVERLRKRIENENASDAFDRALDGVNTTDAALDLLDEEILAAAAQEAGERFSDNPAVEGRLRWSLARTYYDLGMLDQAVEQSLAAYELLRAALPSDDSLRFQAALEAGRALYQVGRYEESESAVLAARAGFEELFGADDELTLKAIGQLGTLYWRWGRLEEARELNETALQGFRRSLGDESPLTIIALGMLAATHQSLGDLDLAERLRREQYETAARALGADAPETIRAAANLSTILFSQRRFDEAERLLTDACERAARVFGKTHYETLAFYNNLGGLYSARGDEASAERLFRDLVNHYAQRVGREDEWSIRFRDSLGKCLARQGKTAEGIAELKRVAEASSRYFGKGSERTIQAWGMLDLFHRDMGNPADRPEALGPLVESLRLAGGEVNLPANWVISFARGLVDGYPPAFRDPQLAVSYALRANEISDYADASYVHVLAAAYFHSGDAAAAVDAERRAIGLLTQDQPELRGRYESELARYEAGRD